MRTLLVAWMCVLATPLHAREPVVAPRPPRNDTTGLLPVRELIADAGVAPIPFIEWGDGPEPTRGVTRVRYVFVRGVWPIVAGRRKAPLVPADFELARQSTGPGGGIAESAWEVIDTGPFGELLNRAAGFEVTNADHVSDACITGPVPLRSDRKWGDEATHPTAEKAAPGELALFRCADLTAVPGETYRYRVRVRVLDQTAGRHPAVAAEAQPPQRWTEWSEPTERVTVPR